VRPSTTTGGCVEAASTWGPYATACGSARPKRFDTRWRAPIWAGDDFIDSVRSKVTPGTSALFLLSSGAVGDKVFGSLKEQGVHGELIQTNLSQEDEARLREAFDENS
jgi:hypothetical protein